MTRWRKELAASLFADVINSFEAKNLVNYPYHPQSKQVLKRYFCEVWHNSLRQCSVGLNGHNQDIVMVSVLTQMLQILRNSVGLKGVTPFATRLNLGSQPETGLTAAIYALLALTSYELRRYYLYIPRSAN